MVRMMAAIMMEVAMLIMLTVAPPANAGQDAPSKMETIMGCVQRGDAITAYKLVGKGGVWRINGPKDLRIGRQLDHAVSLRGKLVKDFGAKKAGDVSSDPHYRGLFEISRITTLSKTCELDKY